MSKFLYELENVFQFKANPLRLLHFMILLIISAKIITQLFNFYFVVYFVECILNLLSCKFFFQIRGINSEVLFKNSKFYG